MSTTRVGCASNRANRERENQFALKPDYLSLVILLALFSPVEDVVRACITR